MHSLVTSVLAYGSILYACLGDIGSTLSAHSVLYESAEALVRTMYRWALR